MKLKTFIVPLLLFCVGAFFLHVAPHILISLALENDYRSMITHHVGQVFYWAAGAAFTVRLINLLFWDVFFKNKMNVASPRLLRDIVSMCIWVTFFFLCLNFVFQFEVSGLVTASGITIAIIGFALRNMISDVFTGIAMGIEQPLRSGDWIEMEDGIIGYVDEINWRATRLITRDEVTKIIPNSFLATHPFVNYSRPHAFFRDHFEIILSYDVTAHQAERLLLSAVSQIPESTNIPRKPEVRILEYLEHGVKWDIRYWIPDYESQSSVSYKVQRNVLRNLHYAGVKVARQKLEFLNLSDLKAEEMKLSEDMAFLRSIEIFSPLTLQELENLKNNLTRRLCLAGQAVVQEGDAQNTSLFLVQEGYLTVSMTNDHGEEINVGWLAPGMFFGEMALLTGESRSANVTPSIDSILLEIRKEDIAPLLEQSEILVKKLSHILATRKDVNLQTLSQSLKIQEPINPNQITDIIFQKISKFFGLKN